MPLLDAIANLSWLAVALASLTYYLLGALWFTPLFGKAWDRSIGFDRPRDYRFGAIYYLTPLVSSIVIATATAILVNAHDPKQIEEALLLGLVVGVGYSAAVSVTNAVTPITPKPLLFGVITGSYHVVGIVIASAVTFVLK